VVSFLIILCAFIIRSSTINGPMTSAKNPFHISSRGVEETRKRVLFFTSSEYGQANVILAVIYEILLRREFEVHLASFGPLQKRVKELNGLAVTNEKTAAVFHTVPGKSALEALTAKDEFIGPYRPGIRGAIDTYRVTLPAVATAWNEHEYMTGYESCSQILQDVKPDVTVVDPLFSQGLEACTKIPRECVILSPNTLQDILRKRQPFFRFHFFRYPA